MQNCAAAIWGCWRLRLGHDNRSAGPIEASGNVFAAPLVDADQIARVSFGCRVLLARRPWRGRESHPGKGTLEMAAP